MKCLFLFFFHLKLELLQIASNEEKISSFLRIDISQRKLIDELNINIINNLIIFDGNFLFEYYWNRVYTGLAAQGSNCKICNRLTLSSLNSPFSIHYKPRIAVAILDLQWMKMTWKCVAIEKMYCYY